MLRSHHIVVLFSECEKERVLHRVRLLFPICLSTTTISDSRQLSDEGKSARQEFEAVAHSPLATSLILLYIRISPRSIFL